MEYSYERNDLVLKYDNSLKKSYFINELKDENKYILNKAKRKIISKEHLNKCVYMASLKEDKVPDGYSLTLFETTCLFIPFGNNIFYLAYCVGNKQYLDCLLYTFMENHECVIDVSKYGYLFKDFILENTYRLHK